MKRAILGLFCLFILLSSMKSEKKFPKFNLPTYNGGMMTEKVFEGKTSLVVLYSLGCPPAMVLMKDLDSLNKTLDTSKYQIIGVLENTQQQLYDFFTDTASVFGGLNKYWKIDEVSYPLVVVCKKDRTKYSEDKVQIRSNCRKISIKVWSWSTPTLMVVNSAGRITKRTTGHLVSNSTEKRLKWIEDFYFE